MFSFAHCTMLLLQIHIDIPRMNPLIPLFQQTTVQEVGLKVNYFKLYNKYLTIYTLCLIFDFEISVCSVFSYTLFIVSKIFERILYIWAIRHPASGYVQGINDLVTPFFITFLSEHIAEGISFIIGQHQKNVCSFLTKL